MKFGTQEHILVLDDGHVIKYEHLKLKMADARHFKNSFWPCRLSDFSEILHREAE